MELCRHTKQRGKLKAQLHKIAVIKKDTRLDLLPNRHESERSRLHINDSLFQLPPLVNHVASMHSLHGQQSSFVSFREIQDDA